jgi:hypothetical protein
MRYLWAFATVTLLAGNAFAATPIRGTVVKGRSEATSLQVQTQNKAMTLHIGMDASGEVIVQEGSSAFSLDPATGKTMATQPEPAENAHPIPGIGIVVKRNPGTSAERAIPVGGDGNALIPSDLEDGSYDLTIRIPRSSLATAPAMGTARKAAASGDVVARLTFVRGSGGASDALKTRTKSNMSNE